MTDEMIHRREFWEIFWYGPKSLVGEKENKKYYYIISNMYGVNNHF